MTDRTLLATFDDESDLLAATRAVRKQGYSIVDIYTPCAVHGLDEAMGLKPSRLPWVCFVCGIIGAVGMLWFEHWTAAVNWPIDVGGKPWNALPSDIPVAFEFMVLLAGFGSVFALLGVCRLYPGKRAQVPSLQVTDDRFVMVIDQADAAFDLSTVEQLLEEFNVVEIAERVTSSSTSDEEPNARRLADMTSGGQS
ncbi:MAG: DUF3341 domain-containing protein [Planctomycetota bacterium]|nr:DUF3341 domain-containing protein [Planctomycetota bacterium]